MRSFKHLTFNDRLQLEVLLKAGHKPKEIAEILGFHISTIYRELKRGQFEARNSDETREMRYSPDMAQQKQEEYLSAKGADLKIGKDFEFANRLEEIIIENDYSPAAALAQMKKEGFKLTICVSTLYHYIDMGVFLRLSNKNLPVKKKGKKRGYKKIKKQGKASRGLSIEKRSEIINDRSTFGHWEMDTVIGSRGNSKKSLLVLTERKTRKEIIMLLKEHTAAAVVKSLDRIERKLGAKFRHIFKSITVDNGTEFADWEGIERGFRTKRKRTQVYVCHPYSSWERGSNENQNKMIRRKLAKGLNFDDRTQGDIDKIASWINHYPRKIFNYRSAEEMFQEEINKIA